MGELAKTRRTLLPLIEDSYTPEQFRRAVKDEFGSYGTQIVREVSASLSEAAFFDELFDELDRHGITPKDLAKACARGREAKRNLFMLAVGEPQEVSSGHRGTAQARRNSLVDIQVDSAPQIGVWALRLQVNYGVWTDARLGRFLEKIALILRRGFQVLGLRDGSTVLIIAAPFTMAASIDDLEESGSDLPRSGVGIGRVLKLQASTFEEANGFLDQRLGESLLRPRQGSRHMSPRTWKRASLIGWFVADLLQTIHDELSVVFTGLDEPLDPVDLLQISALAHHMEREAAGSESTVLFEASRYLAIVSQTLGPKYHGKSSDIFRYKSHYDAFLSVIDATTRLSNENWEGIGFNDNKRIIAMARTVRNFAKLSTDTFWAHVRDAVYRRFPPNPLLDG